MGRKDSKKKTKGKNKSKASTVHKDELKRGKEPKIKAKASDLDPNTKAPKKAKPGKDFPGQVRKVKDSDLPMALQPDEAKPAKAFKDTDAIKARVKAKNEQRDIIAKADEVITGNSTPEAIKMAKAAKARAEAALGQLQVKPGTDPSDDTADDAAYADASPKKKGKAKGQVAEEVETEKGREFVVGAEGSLTAPTQTVERDHLDRPKIPQFDAAGKPVLDSKKKPKSIPYTRVTTFIKCLEDTTLLERWKMRVLLEGAGLDLDQYQTDDGLDLADSLVGVARKVRVAYDKALAKIGKREAKGELDLGQFGLLRAAAKKEHDDALNALAETALDLGDVHERASKGTNLHALTQAYDLGEVDPDNPTVVKELIAQGLWTASDFVDLEAYRAKMTELGIKHVAVEAFVVDDVKHVAGTLDRASLFKFPGTSRAIRVVGDIKTGNVQFAPGTIGMQLRQYAESKGYDPNNPRERQDLKLSKTKGLLIHLPQGQGKCEVYEVDLDLAAKGLALASQVRSWRNEGKGAYDLSAPIAAS